MCVCVCVCNTRRSIIKNVLYIIIVDIHIGLFAMTSLKVTWHYWLAKHWYFAYVHFVLLYFIVKYGCIVLCCPFSGLSRVSIVTFFHYQLHNHNLLGGSNSDTKFGCHMFRQGRNFSACHRRYFHCTSRFEEDSPESFYHVRNKPERDVAPR